MRVDETKDVDSLTADLRQDYTRDRTAKPGIGDRVCATCKGTGEMDLLDEDGHPIEIVECAPCEGLGWVPRRAQDRAEERWSGSEVAGLPLFVKKEGR